MTAPFCPISHSQVPRFTGTAPQRLPTIPIATDLPSLIRAINAIRDILRDITTSLTINNTYYGQAKLPKLQPNKSYLMSEYPEWFQTGLETKRGVIYNKSKTVDKKQRVYVDRIDAVDFRNVDRDNDQSLAFRYVKEPDSRDGGSPVFDEDFFERIINVHWKKKKPKIYTPNWFWTIAFHGGVLPVEPCEPWVLVPEPHGNILWPPDDHCTWDDPVFHTPSISSEIIVAGKPTGSGAGHSPDHTNGWLVGYGGSITESISVPVEAIPLYPVNCWGSVPYPPPPISAYWSAFCRPSKITKENIGAITINASGISATNRNGVPLRKIRTEMSATRFAGSVTVTFIDEDPPDGTPP